MLYALIGEGKFATVKRNGKTYLRVDDLVTFANYIETEALLLSTEIKTWGVVSPEPDGTIFLRAVAAAKQIGVSRQRLLQLIQDHEILAFRIGRCVVLRPADVRGYSEHRTGHLTGKDARILKRILKETP